MVLLECYPHKIFHRLRRLKLLTTKNRPSWCAYSMWRRFGGKRWWNGVPITRINWDVRDWCREHHLGKAWFTLWTPDHWRWSSSEDGYTVITAEVARGQKDGDDTARLIWHLATLLQRYLWYCITDHHAMTETMPLPNLRSCRCDYCQPWIEQGLLSRCQDCRCQWNH